MKFTFNITGIIIYYLIVKRILGFIKDAEDREGRRVREKRKIKELKVKKREKEGERICMYVHMNGGSKIKEREYKTKAEGQPEK